MVTTASSSAAHQYAEHGKSPVFVGLLQVSLRAAPRIPAKQNEKPTDTTTDTGCIMLFPVEGRKTAPSFRVCIIERARFFHFQKQFQTGLGLNAVARSRLCALARASGEPPRPASSPTGPRGTRRR